MHHATIQHGFLQTTETLILSRCIGIVPSWNICFIVVTMEIGQIIPNCSKLLLKEPNITEH